MTKLGPVGKSAGGRARLPFRKDFLPFRALRGWGGMTKGSGGLIIVGGTSEPPADVTKVSQAASVPHPGGAAHLHGAITGRSLLRSRVTEGILQIKQGTR